MKVGIMKKIAILFIAAFALLGVNTANAQSRTSYFMEGSYFRSEFNPALVPTRGYFMIPVASGFNLNLGTNFLSFDNFIYKRGDQYVTALHSSVTTDELRKQLPKSLKGNVGTNINLFGLGFYTKKIFWSVGANMRMDNNFAISPDLIIAAKSLGNGTYSLGSTSVSSNSYLETYVGTSFPLSDWLTVGVKGKILVGLANVSAELNNRLDIYEDRVALQIDGSWRANCPVIDNRSLANGGDIDVAKLINYDIAYLQQNLMNLGAAIDLGAEMRFLNNHLKVSAAITDLGFIKWGATSHLAGQASGGFEFTGVTIGADGVDTDEIIRPTGDGSGFLTGDDAIQRDGYKGYADRLSYSVNLGAEYNILKNKIAFGLFSQTKVLNTSTYTELTASVNLRPTNWVSATVSHTLLNGNGPGVYGAAINFHPVLLNIYLGVDFIDSNYIGLGEVFGQNLYIPRTAKSLNLYAGVALNFGRPKHLKANKKSNK